MQVSGLILTAIMLAVVMVSAAGANTYYHPDEKKDWLLNSVEEEEVEWGDVIEIPAEDPNTTYTIEVADFHVQTTRIDLDAIERIKGDDYECGDCSDDTYTDQIEYGAKTVSLRIYKNQTLIGSFPFRANESFALKDGSILSTKASSWDEHGIVWNYKNDLYVAVSKITCDFADDDCFCTDPENERATVRYIVRRPAEFEADVTTILPGGEDEEMSEFRSNSRFIAEIQLTNNEMRAYHVRATVSVKPTEMIDGEYPPECTVEKIYVGEHDADIRTWIGDNFPVKLRSDERSNTPHDWFEGDADMVMGTGPKKNGIDTLYEMGCDDITYTVYFKTPSIPKRTEYAIWVNLTYEDMKGNPYQFTDNETTIEILPVIEVKKAIGTEDYAVASEEAAEAYTSDVTYVIYADYEPYVFLTVKNWGNYSIPSLRLVDVPDDAWHRPATIDPNRWSCALPSEMVRVPDMESDRWRWNFSLGPGEIMRCAYPVSLLKPGTYKLGVAAVNWTEDGHNYSVVSYPQSVEIHGPYIEVSKKADPASINQNNTTKIVVDVKNTGDRPTSVTILDQIPMESVLIRPPVARGIVIDEENGTFFLRRVLKAGADETFEYTVDPNRTVMLPPAVVRFVDLTRYEGISVSAMPVLTVEGTEPIGAAAAKVQSESKEAPEAGIASAETAETVKTPVRKEPGFAGILAIIACLAAALFTRHRR